MKIKKLFKIGMALLPIMVSATSINSSIGKGVLHYDQEAGLKDRCINLASENIFKEDVRSTIYYLDLISSKEELYDKISTSTSAEGSYGLFNAGVKSSFVKEVKWNYNSNYILVKATRVTHKESISAKNILLEDGAKKLFLDSKFKFLESCGSSFAKNINYGGEIYGVIEINASTYQEKKRIENSLKASGTFSGGSTSGSASYKRTIKKITSDYSAKVRIRHIGGKQIDIPSTVEGLLNLSSKIEEITDSNPVPISIETRDYSTLANYEHDDINYETMIRQDSINFASNKLKDARELYAKILTVLEYPKSFKRFNERELTTKLGYLDMKIIELKKFVAKSYSFLNDSDPSTLNVDLNVNLPARKRKNVFSRRQRAVPVKCEVKRSPLCGVEGYKKMKTSACNVLGVNTGTGPTCGTVYNQRASANCGVKKYNYGTGKVCGVLRYNQCHHSSCGRKWDGSRKRCRKPACGVQAWKSCSHSAFGVKEYNSCRNPEHGVEKFLTCQHKDFGYNFASCQHLSHGPEKFKSCEVAKVGNQTTFCPNF